MGLIFYSTVSIISLSNLLGIHTKVSAVVAYKLNIPMETISIKGTNNIINPNAQASGGSITSELVCKVFVAFLNNCFEF